jgi:hypothetical protein
MNMAMTTPIKSANKPAQTAYLTFFIPTLPKYKAMI